MTDGQSEACEAAKKDAETVRQFEEAKVRVMKWTNRICEMIQDFGEGTKEDEDLMTETVIYSTALIDVLNDELKDELDD